MRDRIREIEALQDATRERIRRDQAKLDQWTTAVFWGCIVCGVLMAVAVSVTIWLVVRCWR